MAGLHHSTRVVVRPGGGVIQGSFVGGRPRVVQTAAAQPKPAKAAPPVAKPGAVQFKPDARGRLAPPPLPGAKAPPVQLKPGPGGRLAPPPLPPRVVPGRPGPVQAKGAGEAFPLPPGFRLRTGGGQPLPPAIQAHMEGVFGTGFGDVRVHVGNEAASIGALAFTHGTDLYFAPGLYQPHTPHGLRLIGHELTHVVQQRAGRVRNPLGSGVAVVQDRSLEAEADRMGQRAASTRAAARANGAHSVQAIVANRPQSPLAGRTCQRHETIQRLTLLSYAPVHDRPGTDTLAGWHHARVAMTPNETFLAAKYSGYANAGAAPGFCKHYVAYDMVKTAVFQVITGMTITNAVNWLQGLAMAGARTFPAPPAEGGGNYNLGAQPVPNIPNTAPFGAAATYAEATLNTEVDDLIKNLANDPQNLYYRNTSSGDNGGTTLDNPTGHGAYSLHTERTRLNNYRAYLLGLGLNV